MSFRLAHLVNPYSCPNDGFMTRVQEITLESIIAANQHVHPHIEVELLAAQFPGDDVVLPNPFRRTKDLQQSAADFGDFAVARKLPLLAELVSTLYLESSADYLIYSNIDIGLQPNFYNEVARRIEIGYDAFIINRRRIESHFVNVKDLGVLYCQPGKSHPGFDCFVFHRSLVPRFVFEKVCIGIPFMEICFSQNLFCFANKFCLFDRDHLTFHIGMEIFKKRDDEYVRYNRNQYLKALEKLLPFMDIRKFPWSNRIYPIRIFKWALHPAIPIRLALTLEWRRLQRQWLNTVPD